MARLARVVAVGVPHHVTQRGNARRFILDCDADRMVYLNLLRQNIELHGVVPSVTWFVTWFDLVWGAAVGFWIASRMAESALFLQEDREREKKGLTKSVRPVPAWKKWLRRRNG